MPVLSVDVLHLVRSFQLDRSLFSEREYTPDDLDKFLSVRTYVAANCMIQMCLCAVEAIESAAIFSGFFGHTDGGLLFGSRTLDYTLAFFLITFSADMLGFLIGILISSITSIMTVIPIVLIAQLLLSGCLFELDGFLAKIAEFTTAHWGFYALGSIADLNSLPPFNIPQSVFPRNREYVAACFSQLALLTLICIFFSGVLLYLKTNLKEE